MPTSIEVVIGDRVITGELSDSDCARAIAACLPLESRFQTWGEEYYFEIPVRCAAETGARAEVDVGTIAYWPPGRALAFFYGPTPLSGADGRPVAASEVNRVGTLFDPSGLRPIPAERRILVRVAGPAVGQEGER